MNDIGAYVAELHQYLDEPQDCHISERELCCHDAKRTPYPEEFWKDGTLDRVIKMFETIRKEVGLPIVIGCGYRTPEHNAAVGGGKQSQHLYGRALDLHTPEGMLLDTFHGHVLRVARLHGTKLIGGLGLYDWGCHVDCRPRAHPHRYAFWDYRSKE